MLFQRLCGLAVTPSPALIMRSRHYWPILLEKEFFFLLGNKDAPVPRAIQAVGRIYANPILGGLHHQYVRI